MLAWYQARWDRVSLVKYSSKGCGWRGTCSLDDDGRRGRLRLLGFFLPMPDGSSSWARQWCEGPRFICPCPRLRGSGVLRERPRRPLAFRRALGREIWVF